MKLITVNEVSYNTGRVVGNSTGKVTMAILGFNHVGKPQEDGTVNHSIEVEYKYSDSEEGVIAQGVFNLRTKEEIDSFHAQVKMMIPVFTTKTKAFEDEILVGAKIEFANTFGISPADIEEVII